MQASLQRNILADTRKNLKIKWNKKLDFPVLSSSSISFKQTRDARFIVLVLILSGESKLCNCLQTVKIYSRSNRELNIQMVMKSASLF